MRERWPATNGPPRTNARSAGGTSPVAAPRRVASLHSPTRVSTSPLAATRARASTRGADASTELPRASTTLPHPIVTPPPSALPREKSSPTPESDSSARNSPSSQVVWCSPDSSRGAGAKSVAGAKPSAGAKPPAGAKPAGVKPTAGAKSKASRIPVLSPEKQAAAEAAKAETAKARAQSYISLKRQTDAAMAEAAAAASAEAEAEACKEEETDAEQQRQWAESEAQRHTVQNATIEEGRRERRPDSGGQTSRRGAHKSPAGERHPSTARGAAPHSPPLAAPTGAGPPAATGSRSRSSHGSSHGSPHGSSGPRRPRAEPLLARGGGEQEAGGTPPPALRMEPPTTLPSVEPAMTTSLSPRRVRGTSERGVSSDAWANLTREVDYAKQRAQRAEKELLELRLCAAGLQAALEQAKRDMADAASVATLRHEEAARRREKERAHEQRGEEARPVPSPGPCALPRPITPAPS